LMLVKFELKVLKQVSRFEIYLIRFRIKNK
jgi:hypothetical protein